MSYRVYSVTGDLQALADAGEWLTPADDGYRFDFESDPLFGSPTAYEGVITTVDGRLIIGNTSGSPPDTVVKRLNDNLPIGAEAVDLTPAEQHRMIDAYDGYATQIGHPSYAEAEVAEIARLKALQSNQDVKEDDIRAEARSEEYPVLAGCLRKDGDTVKFYLKKACQFSSLPDADLHAATWVGSVIADIKD